MRKFQVLERGARLAKLREQAGRTMDYPVYTLYPYPHVVSWHITRGEARMVAKHLNREAEQFKATEEGLAQA